MAEPEAPQVEEAEEEEEEELPAWSLPADAVGRITIPVEWPARVDRDWAVGGSAGRGARVGILDSGLEPGHPPIGEVQGAGSGPIGADDEPVVSEDEQG